jgi:hypothetical protein
MLDPLKSSLECAIILHTSTTGFYMAALMVVPNGVTFNVVDDNTDRIVGAFPTASAAAGFIREGVKPTDTTYQTAMAEAKAEYTAWMRSLEEDRLTSIEEGEE